MLLEDHPGDHNQAMMEFGALQCVPASPVCPECPVQHYCRAFSEGRVDELPRKLKKGKIKKRYFTYLIIKEGTYTYIQRRTGNDIWREMYEFPLIEHEHDPEEAEIIRTASAMTGLAGERMHITTLSAPVQHQLTHRKIITRFLHLNTEGELRQPPGHWKRVRFSEVGDHPLPRLIDRYLELNGDSPE